VCCTQLVCGTAEVACSRWSAFVVFMPALRSALAWLSCVRPAARSSYTVSLQLLWSATRSASVVLYSTTVVVHMLNTVEWRYKNNIIELPSILLVSMCALYSPRLADHGFKLARHHEKPIHSTK
jgi:hypothetical protein